MNYAKEILRLHEEWRGKIEVKAIVPESTRQDLLLHIPRGCPALS